MLKPTSYKFLVILFLIMSSCINNKKNLLMPNFNSEEELLELIKNDIHNSSLEYDITTVTLPGSNLGNLPESNLGNQENEFSNLPNKAHSCFICNFSNMKDENIFDDLLTKADSENINNVSLEYTIYHPDGGTALIHSECVIERAGDGSVATILGTAQVK